MTPHAHRIQAYRPKKKVLRFGGAGGNILRPGETLRPGQFLQSPNGHFRYRLTPNGAAVERDGIPVWGGYTVSGVTGGTMQADGNFVIYNNNGEKIWDSSTHNGGGHPGGPGTYLQMQDDGNLVAYAPDGGGIKPVWDSAGYSIKGSWLTNAVSDIGDALGDAADAVVDFTQSPIWQVIAGAAVFIPGIGVGISAGMEAACLAGKVLKGKSNVAAAASAGMSIATSAGFDAGLGVIVQNPTGASLDFARNQLGGDPTAQAGFDAAIALAKGMAAGPPPSEIQTPEAKAAYYAAVGLRGAPPSIIQKVTPAVTTTPAAKAGYVVGVVVTSNAKPSLVKWILQRVQSELRWLHVVR